MVLTSLDNKSHLSPNHMCLPFIIHAFGECMYSGRVSYDKNIERHTAHTIASWPNPKQWVIVHTSDLMMMIKQSIYILSIITKEMGKLKTHSPTYCIMDNRELREYA